MGSPRGHRAPINTKRWGEDQKLACEWRNQEMTSLRMSKGYPGKGGGRGEGIGMMIRGQSLRPASSR